MMQIHITGFKAEWNDWGKELENIVDPTNTQLLSDSKPKAQLFLLLLPLKGTGKLKPEGKRQSWPTSLVL